MADPPRVAAQASPLSPVPVPATRATVSPRSSISSGTAPLAISTSVVNNAPPLSPLPPSAQPAKPIPPLLAHGVPMFKVSSKKIKPVIVQVGPKEITWPSLKGGKVEIKAIRELRLGHSPTDEYDGARWITIVYVRDKQWKVVHFIAHTDDVYALWVKTLRDLVSASADRLIPGAHDDALGGPGCGGDVSGSNGAAGPKPPAVDPDSLLIRQLWPTGVQMIDRSTAASLCSQLGVVVSKETLAAYAAPLDITSFRRLVRHCQTRPELEEIHKSMGGDMTRETVSLFLRNTQGEGEGALLGHEQTPQDLVFARYADAKSGLWTAESIASFLASPDNVPYTKQDLTRPLPEYYIASSHNTYLVADQWRGTSTVEGYVRVLLAGCRCVEIDCHNGDTEPIVYHANTITSSVSVRDVLQVIKKYAFIASPYPVVVSLENRCSVEQSDKLAIIIDEVLGDVLVKERLDMDGIPSPEDLKGRILVKAKAAPPPKPSRQSSSTLSTSPTLDSSESTTTESDSSLVRLARRLSMSTPRSERVKTEPRSKTSPPGFSQLLCELPVYTAGVKYRGFSKLVTYEPHHMFSVSESTANRILREDQTADWIKHNYTHLTRVYPKGVRLTSSNFDPTPYWAVGCQMVAINYQTFDEGSTSNHALFHAGGYVLKPDILRYKVPNALPMQKFRVKFRIISAQRLPPTADLYVKGTINGDMSRTKTSHGISIAPRWGEELSWVVDANPALLGLVFITIEIKARSDGIELKTKPPLAQWTRSLADAGRGYRYLSLEDQHRSKYLFATLFVKIDVTPLSPPPPSGSAASSPRSIPTPVPLMANVRRI